MPTLKLNLSPPLHPDRHAALAHALTAITAEVLGKRAEVTAVVIEEVQASHWFVGATTQRKPTALLEISITSGTNTAEQKADFIRAAFAELQGQLAPDGELEEASYVIVREVPATDWGYGGTSQNERKRLSARPGANQRQDEHPRDSSTPARVGTAPVVHHHA